MEELIDALREQTKAIGALVESNQRLMMILVEGMSDDEEIESTHYLDGSPK